MSRYLKRQRNLTREALDRLLTDEPGAEPIAARPEHRPSMHGARLQTVLATARQRWHPPGVQLVFGGFEEFADVRIGVEVTLREHIA